MNYPASRLVPALSIHTAEEQVAKRPLRAANQTGTPVDYQIYYYNGLTCQQKRGENVESRISTKYYSNKRIQLKIRCFTGEGHPVVKVPGLGEVPVTALFGAVGEFAGAKILVRNLIKPFVKRQMEEILVSAKTMRKVYIIGHSLGGRIVNMIAEEVAKWPPVWRDKFTIITLGSVEKMNIGAPGMRSLDFTQVMNIDDLVLNGLFQAKRRAEEVRRIFGRTRELGANNRVGTTISNWKKWPSLKKVLEDKSDRIVWIETSGPRNANKIHGDYDKKEGLLKAIISQLDNRIRNNNARQANRLRQTQSKVRARKQAGLLGKRVGARGKIVSKWTKAELNAARRQASQRAVQRATAAPPVENQGHILNQVRNLIGPVRNASRTNILTFFSDPTSLSQVASFMATARTIARFNIAQSIRNTAATLTNAQIDSMVDNVINTLKGIIMDTMSAKLDWSIAMVLLNSDNIKSLNVVKYGNKYFTPDELYRWASNNVPSEYNRLYSFIPNPYKKSEISPAKKVQIRNYVRRKIEEEGFPWVWPRLQSFLMKFVNQVAETEILKLVWKGAVGKAGSLYAPVKETAYLAGTGALLYAGAPVAAAILAGHAAKNYLGVETFPSRGRAPGPLPRAIGRARQAAASVMQRRRQATAQRRQAAQRQRAEQPENVVAPPSRLKQFRQSVPRNIKAIFTRRANQGGRR